jgi:molecular chaperone HscB
MINYFQLYQLPQSFHIDAAQVKKKYYELSRLYHPDRFAQAGDAERLEALRMAALNNEAYKTLNNEDALMEYVLKLHGVLEDEEKYSLPPDFLMEMMELNELVSEYEMEPENADLRQQATHAMQAQLQDWAGVVIPLTRRYDDGDHSQGLLLQLKDYYFRKKYLLRIQERMNTFASR